jgi:hypothetical protein
MNMKEAFQFDGGLVRLTPLGRILATVANGVGTVLLVAFLAGVCALVGCTLGLLLIEHLA